MNKNFLWIIRTDPELHPSLLDELKQSLHGQSNYILLGSNFNPEGFGREDLSYNQFLRRNSKNDEIAPVFSGNITLLKHAYDASSESILLETRLDADDGLHRDFVQTVQNEARHLSVEKSWRIWCVNYNAEWHPLSPFAVRNGTKDDEGYLVMYSDPNIW